MALLIPALALLSVPQVHAAGCRLDPVRGRVKHVIVIQFDNVHFTRDIPNVASDLEQMPHLIGFVEGTGALLSNHHATLIARTATDTLTTLTGVYPDRHGTPISNSFRYFEPNGTSATGSVYTYWNQRLYDLSTPSPIDQTYNLLTRDRRNAPAPWVPFTRAGCDVGVVASTDTVLENIDRDVAGVFGPGSPQALEVAGNPQLALADFVGVAVHCAAGDPLCATANNGVVDVLPDEPGGYAGYRALFGHKYVAPQISPNGPLTDLGGDVIRGPGGYPGFPGLDSLNASAALAYVAAMQEHGVPVTFAEIANVHDAHPSGPSYGPGESGYEAALRSYDVAFDRFFARLAADGIDGSNTLFVFTADEGDHFVGSAPFPPKCDGPNIACTYSQIGELDANLAGLLATEQNVTTPFRVHADSAPAVYITGNPARDSAVTRVFERATGALTALNPMSGQTDVLTQFLADPVELQLLHMVTGDVARTPSFIAFENPDYFVYAGAPSCGTACVTQDPAFAWNQGNVQPEITTTWLGLAGPGVKNTSLDAQTWSDHADVRPTILSLAGLTDSYVHDGRLLVEALTKDATPAAVRNSPGFLQLARAYKQLDAAAGQFGTTSLAISTTALASGSAADDSLYARLEQRLAALGSARDGIAAQMVALLEDAEFHDKVIPGLPALHLLAQADAVMNDLKSLAAVR